MAYAEALAARVRKQLEGRADVEEKRMFGGLAFLVRGTLAVGVLGDDLVVRVAPEQTEPFLRGPNVRPFDLRGRPMKGWLLVEPAGVATSATLARWVARGVTFAASVPPKQGTPAKDGKGKVASKRASPTGAPGGRRA